jgi:hypothetical protein
MYELAELRDSFNVVSVDGSEVELRSEDFNTKSAGQVHAW